MGLVRGGFGGILGEISGKRGGVVRGLSVLDCPQFIAPFYVFVFDDVCEE